MDDDVFAEFSGNITTEEDIATMDDIVFAEYQRKRNNILDLNHWKTIRQCHPPDEISYSTLGSPIDATPITPRPIPAEIEFKLPLCLRNNQYASVQRDDTYPPILNEQQVLTVTYIATSFEPIPLDVISDVPSYDTFTNIDSFLTQQGYDELVGK
jgi:hypothetical protein